MADIAIALKVSDADLATFQQATGDATLIAVKERFQFILRTHFNQVVQEAARLQTTQLASDLLNAPTATRQRAISSARQELAR